MKYFSYIIKGLILIYTTLLFPLNFFVVTRAVSPNSTQIDEYEYVIVLGAGILCDRNLVNCKPSQVLQKRLDKALELSQKSSNLKILVTGDGRDEFYSETDTMKDYLLDSGLDSEKILIDPLGIDTRDSCKNAVVEFNISKAIVVTQNFHLNRAYYLCSDYGLKVLPVPAQDNLLSTKMFGYFREIGASWKAILGF